MNFVQHFAVGGSSGSVHFTEESSHFDSEHCPPSGEQYLPAHATQQSPSPGITSLKMGSGSSSGGDVGTGSWPPAGAMGTSSAIRAAWSLALPLTPMPSRSMKESTRCHSPWLASTKSILQPCRVS